MKNLQYIISFLFVFLACCIGQIPAQAFQKLIYNQEKNLRYTDFAQGKNGEIVIGGYAENRNVIIKVDAEGTPIWAKEIYWDSIDLRFIEIVVADNGDIGAVATYPVQHGTLGYRYSVLFRFSPGGELLWSRRIGKIDDVYIPGRNFEVQDMISLGDDLILATNMNVLYELLVVSVDIFGNIKWARGFQPAGDLSINSGPFEGLQQFNDSSFLVMYVGHESQDPSNLNFSDEIQIIKMKSDGTISDATRIDFNSELNGYYNFSYLTILDHVNNKPIYICQFFGVAQNIGKNLFWGLEDDLEFSFLEENLCWEPFSPYYIGALTTGNGSYKLAYFHNRQECNESNSFGVLSYDSSSELLASRIVEFWPYQIDDWYNSRMFLTLSDNHQLFIPLKRDTESLLVIVNFDYLNTTSCKTDPSAVEGFEPITYQDSVLNMISRDEPNMQIVNFPVEVWDVEIFEEEYCQSCVDRFQIQNQLIPSECETEPVVTIIPSVFGGAGPYDFYWTSEAGTFSDSLLIDVPPGYYVLTIEDRICCDTTIVIDATAASLLTVVINSETDTACYGEIVQLSSVSPPFTTPIWNTGDAGLETEVTVLSDTVITAEVVSGNCLLRDSFHLYAWPELVVEAGPDTTVPYGQTIQLFATGGAVYQWSGGELSCIACPDPQTMIFEDTEFTVAITDANGCSAVDTISIRVSDIRIYIPNVFSPNGDGINDQFQVFAPELARFRMRIFSRWGDLVFGTEDQHFQWDGNLKEAMLPAGVYTYHIVADTYSGETIERVGDLTLVR